MNYTYVKNKIDSLIEELQQLKAVIDSDGVVEAVTIDQEYVKTILLRVINEVPDGKEVVSSILKKHGANKVSELNEMAYGLVVVEAQECLNAIPF